MSNIALPSTGSFIGEFLILVGIFKTNIVTCFVAATGMIWGGAYSLWLYNRIVFGNLKIQFLVLFTDTNKREFVCVLPLLVCTLLFGLFPSIFLKFIHFNVEMSIASSFCF
jgi:NADH-quinone oxidoreductase subunit M